MARLHAQHLDREVTRSGHRRKGMPARKTGGAPSRDTSDSSSNPRRFVALSVAIAMSASATVPIAAHAQDGLQEVRITGSRITTVEGINTPTPVTAVEATELEQMAPGSIVEALSQLPQFAGNIGSEQIVGGQNSGGANVNLRGAGVNRTLVLLDGRRVVSSNRFGTVDVNMFPEALLKGVELVTGGASASYGTDAVAGVANFILDTDFTGVKTHLQGGQTTRDDGRNWEASLAFGHRFGEKLHLIASVGADEQEAISDFDSLSDREYFNQTARVAIVGGTGPRHIIRPYVTATNFTYGGVIVEPSVPELNFVTFNPDGTTGRLAYTGVGSFSGTGNCSCFAQDSRTFGLDRDNEVAPGYRRKNAFVHLTYDASENTELFAQALVGETRNNDRRESISLLSTWQGRIHDDNPFLPGNVRTLMQQNNREFVGFGLFGLDTPESPIGDSRQVTQNRLASVTLGFNRTFRASFLDGWRLEAYFQHGDNRQDFITQNGIRTDRLPLAMDVVTGPDGRPVCRVSLPQFDPRGIFSGCVPVNLFGGVENLTPEQVAWIRDDGKVARQWTSQNFTEAVLSGQLWEGWGAGPLSAAFGASYRSDRLRQRTLDPSDEFPALPDGTLLAEYGLVPWGIRGVSAQSATGGIPGLRFVPAGYAGDANSSSVLFSSLRAIEGRYNVKEAFAEFQIPALRDLPAIQGLEFNAAARWANYSGSGEIWAGKLGAVWDINDQVRLRVTQSRDVRAATLQERFDQTRGGVNVIDPANGNTTVTTASFSGGNPLVQPEKADTTTIGLVLKPSFLAGFTATVDWYRIDIDDAIAQLSAQNIVTGCFNGDTTLCQYVIRRDGLPNGFIDRVENLFINLQVQKISGVDLELNYRTQLGQTGQTLGWRFYGTFLDHNAIQNRDGPVDERVGQLGPGIANVGGLPRYRFTTHLTYGIGPFSAFLQGRWIDGGILDRTFRECRADCTRARPDGTLEQDPFTIEDNTVPSTFYMDMTLKFRALDDDLEIYGTVTNLLDREPVYTPGVIGRAGTNEFNAFLYDVVGRRYVVGFNYRF
jgi:iron complex outermembrane receptor protein